MATAPMPKRGEVWLIDFDPPVGAEMAKIRPAVIINEDHIGRLPLRLVVPITDWKSRKSRNPPVQSERASASWRARRAVNKIDFIAVH